MPERIAFALMLGALLALVPLLVLVVVWAFVYGTRGVGPDWPAVFPAVAFAYGCALGWRHG